MSEKTKCETCGHDVIFHQINEKGKPRCIDCKKEGKECARFHPFY